MIQSFAVVVVCVCLCVSELVQRQRGDLLWWVAVACGTVPLCHVLSQNLWKVAPFCFLVCLLEVCVKRTCSKHEYFGYELSLLFLLVLAKDVFLSSCFL